MPAVTVQQRGLPALFVIELAEGAVDYARRSLANVRHIPGSNAIIIHVVLAVAAAAAVASIQTRRAHQPAQRGRRSPWAAPFSASAVAQLGQVIWFARGLSLRNLAKVIAIVPLALVLLYTPFQTGQQVTGGLDSNATVNAWGRPTYAGALVAHWLDCLAVSMPPPSC